MINDIFQSVHQGFGEVSILQMVAPSGGEGKHWLFDLPNAKPWKDNSYAGICQIRAFHLSLLRPCFFTPNRAV